MSSKLPSSFYYLLSISNLGHPVAGQHPVAAAAAPPGGVPGAPCAALVPGAATDPALGAAPVAASAVPEAAGSAQAAWLFVELLIYVIYTYIYAYVYIYIYILYIYIYVHMYTWFEYEALP